MTQIDFYILEEGSNKDIHHICCQLTEKAFLQQYFVLIQARDIEQAVYMDTLLWQFKPESFIAHQLLDNALSAPDFPYPVLINTTERLPENYNPARKYETLINLGNVRPEFYSQFHRLAEIVAAHEPDKKAARERYRFYKNYGYPIKVHQLG